MTMKLLTTAALVLGAGMAVAVQSLIEMSILFVALAILTNVGLPLPRLALGRQRCTA